MTPIPSSVIADPLRAFVQGAFIAGTERPVPLISTRFDVDIEHGLAIVSTTRTFRNDESKSIEATITFPVPVHAVLFELQARIEGRVLKAKAQRNKKARETYEAALERGKTTVLHEEVLRGVNMLSVGHIPPGAEIQISATWTLTLTNINGRGCLRIPLTVGDIYGRSALPDSDNLIHGGLIQMADLAVSCRDGQIALRGGSLQNGTARVPLNAPIDLEVSGWTSKELLGRAFDGREVSLTIKPSTTADAALHVALMIDHSGSMDERCSDDSDQTKHEAVVRALRRIDSEIGSADIIEIWEFDNNFHRVGSTQGGNRLNQIIKQLNKPAGGTEIGRALAGVTHQSKSRDVLLITDGKSHELDVQALARTGHRFSVVLVGEDSLEANVGHLAALTGGEIFVAGTDLAEMLTQSLRSLRKAHQPVGPIKGSPQCISVCRAGMSISASWHKAERPLDETTSTRAVASISASLALSALDDEIAAQLAEAEGLVSHLTSLILIDEAGVVQKGMPGARKVLLPKPSALVAMSYSLRSSGIETYDPFMQRLDTVSYKLSNDSSFNESHRDLDSAITPIRTEPNVDVPIQFRRLVELIEESPSRLEPGHACGLLSQAGFERELKDIFQHAEYLGLEVETVSSIILAGLLTGKLGNGLSADVQSACIRLREFAQRAMEVMREIGNSNSASMDIIHVVKNAAELNIVQSARAHEIIQALDRLTGYRTLLQKMEIFQHEQIEQLNSYQSDHASRIYAAGYLDLSDIGTNIDWGIEPDRLRVGDLSSLDQAIVVKIQDAAALMEAVTLAKYLSIDPIVLIVGLLARSEAKKNRTAARIATALLGKAPSRELTSLSKVLQII